MWSVVLPPVLTANESVLFSPTNLPSVFAVVGIENLCPSVTVCTFSAPCVTVNEPSSISAASLTLSEPSVSIEPVPDVMTHVSALSAPFLKDILANKLTVREVPVHAVIVLDQTVYQHHQFTKDIRRPVTDTLDTPRSALSGAGMPAQARSVSFAEGVRGDARECLTRARRERRAERVARRPTRASRVVVEESARSRTPPRHRGRAPPANPPEASRGRAARRGRGPRG